jgi:hypothetical protein
MHLKEIDYFVKVEMDTFCLFLLSIYTVDTIYMVFKSSPKIPLSFSEHLFNSSVSVFGVDNILFVEVGNVFSPVYIDGLSVTATDVFNTEVDATESVDGDDGIETTATY